MFTSLHVLPAQMHSACCELEELCLEEFIGALMGPSGCHSTRASAEDVTGRPIHNTVHSGISAPAEVDVNNSERWTFAARVRKP